MSMDMIVYIQGFNEISKEGCEKYLEQFGIQAQAHPETNFQTDTGFLPFKVEFPFIENLKGSAFLSGFEIFPDTYDYQQDLKEANEIQSPKIKRGGIKGLFKKTSAETAETQANNQVFIADSDVDSILMGCCYRLELCYRSMDELILALAVSSYLAETGAGVAYDPQTGDYYYRDFKKVLSKYMEEAFDSLELGMMNPFEDWG